MAIMTPLRPRMGKTVTLCLTMAMWVLGIALSSPYLLFYTTFVEIYRDGEQRVICYGEWPDGPTNESMYEYA